MTHVAIVIPGIDRLAGAESQAILLAMGLAKREWKVSMVALSGNGGESAAGLSSAGVEFVSLEMRKGLADPRGWVRFQAWSRREAPDVVHAHLAHGAWMARVSRLFSPGPVVIDTVHTSAIGGLTNRWGYRCTRWLPHRVTTVSAEAAAAYVEAGMISRDRARVVNNGIDTDEWQPDGSTRDLVRAEFGVTNGFFWLAAGRLEPLKDYISLLTAMSRLPDHARLAIAGTGTMEIELKRVAAELRIEERVRFIGFQKDVRRWMQAADAFVHCSLWEGLPMSLLEAGACALPSVGTDVPGTREVLIDGETGFLATPRSADSLSANMARMMEITPESRRSMGDAARRRIVERYRLDRIIDQWEELYRELLNDRARGMASRRAV